MKKLLIVFLLTTSAMFAQKHPLQELIDAARADSPALKDLLSNGPLGARGGAAVWGQDFLFAVESDTPASVSIDKAPALEMKRVSGSNYYYLLKTLRMGTTHQYRLLNSAGDIRSSQVAAYNPDSYPLPGAPRGKLSEMKTLTSKLYPGMTSNYWVYVNPGADIGHGAPLMVWQDGQNIAGDQDWLNYRLKIVSDNLVAKGLIPPMVHVLIQPGMIGDRRMRSIEYDTVSGKYGDYVVQEVLADVEKTYKLRHDAYSRAIAGESSGAIAAFDVAWRHNDQFSRVLSHIGSYTSIQWHPEQNQEGGYIVAHRVRREDPKNIRIWMSDGSDDLENQFGSWPMNNIQLANSLKMRGYDFHFRFGVSLHSSAQGALDLPESLTWLWRDYDPNKTEQHYEQDPAEADKPFYRVGIVSRDAW